MATKINKEYNFNCGLCNKPTNIETIDKGSTFSGHKLTCTECSHTGYMFVVFVPGEKDLDILMEKYKSARYGTEEKDKDCGGCDDDTNKCGCS
jgi:hypothetical protein